MRGVLLIAALWLAGAGMQARAAEPLVPGVPDEETLLVRDLLATTGSKGLGEQMMRAMLESVKQGKSEHERRVIDRFAAKLDLDELDAQLVRLYAEKFDAAELRAMVGFFKSDVGRKYVAALPDMLANAMRIGEIWAQSKAAELQAELEREKARPTSL
ncbi:MAG: DUF2059 domain-containing protein [Pseudomonadota bacterium]